MIHYHGTPITPRAQLLRMRGRHFCVPFSDPRDSAVCMSIAQSIMFDNGAFSTFTRGKVFLPKKYYAWLDKVLSPPHWAIMPDRIKGDVAEQKKMLRTWPRTVFGIENCSPVFHLHLPLSYLLYLCDHYPKVSLGSSAQFWTVGGDQWAGRMDEIFNCLSTRQVMPWIHGLRMLGQHSGRWPLASADSTNVAQNYKPGCAECMAARIDSAQPAAKWSKRLESRGLFK